MRRPISHRTPPPAVPQQSPPNTAARRSSSPRQATRQVSSTTQSTPVHLLSQHPSNTLLSYRRPVPQADQRPRVSKRCHDHRRARRQSARDLHGGHGGDQPRPRPQGLPLRAIRFSVEAAMGVVEQRRRDGRALGHSQVRSLIQGNCDATCRRYLGRSERQGSLRWEIRRFIKLTLPLSSA